MRVVVGLLPVLISGCSEYNYAESLVTERFDQRGEGEAADVLFVLDDSASMAEESARLQANFAAYAALMEGSVTDWRLAVVTTDAEGDEGYLRGPILGPDTGELAAQVVAQLRVGTQGSRDEQGLRAASLAVDGRNPGFPRQGFPLHVAVFSDEDDHSAGPVEQWTGPVVDAFGRDRVHFHAIVGDMPEGCASAASAADAGPRYLAAAVNTGGWRSSICAEDYAPALANIGLDLTGLQDAFGLSHYPDPDTLGVTTDGVEVPEDAADGWQYDPGRNAIVFVGGAVPPAGAEVAVSYRRLAESQAP